MITTILAKPGPAVAPYIRSYIYREFDTLGLYTTKPKHAVHEIAMHFFFKGLPVKLTDPITGNILKTGKALGVSGLSSQLVGEMTFNGFYSFFEIAFTPHGFQTLFGIPSSETLNKIVWSEEILDKSINILHEQLCHCSNVQQMAAVTDNYLLRRLQKQKAPQNLNTLVDVIRAINREKGSVNIDKLASHVNMSIRNFERLFIQSTGIPAKLFCSILRFNYALELKLRNPQLRWTYIAHEAGYFDQTHLVKDFKKFSGDTPSILLKETPLFIENYAEQTR